MWRLLVVAFLCSIASATNFVANGDFEQPLTAGWTEECTAPAYTITRGTAYDPDPDYEVYVYQYDCTGYTQIYQFIDIPTIDINFSLNAQMFSSANAASGGWAAAAIIISYIDEFDSVMGETRICRRAGACPWINTSTVHLIAVTDSIWHGYSFNITDELKNLSAVSSAHVKKLKVALYDEVLSC